MVEDQKKKKKLWIEEGEEMLSQRKSIWIGFEKETRKLAYCHKGRIFELVLKKKPEN